MLVFLDVVLWGVAGVVMLFLLLVVRAAFYVGRSHRGMLERAAQMPCPKCGKVLGRAAVLAGKERWSLQMEALRKKHPGSKLLTVAEWEIKCPSCGSRVYFCPNDEQLTLNRAS